ncbi:MAG TPA: triose-phosphate isomerase [Methylomirabilota bacterium]|nr:triose-phosphate isomerase [Methylomirabilota bacterium]
MTYSPHNHEPLILVNFKTYSEATGKNAVELARKISEVGHNEGVKVAVAPQFCDIIQIVTGVGVPVFGQHVDAIGPGAYTGHVTADSLKAAGATGTLLNHSERMIKLADIRSAIIRSRELGLLTVVCAGDVASTAAVSMLMPDMVAIEPPELIGTGRAVSREKPEVITDSVKRIREVNPTVKILCGAGITTGDDVYTALKLGAEGFLIASGVVRAPDPTRVMTDFCEAANRFSRTLK